MYKKLTIFIMIAVMMIVMQACGAKKKESQTQEHTEAMATTENSANEEVEPSQETTEATIAREVVVDYSMPAGESVERTEDSTNEVEVEDSQDRSDEAQEAVKPAETVPPIVIEKEDCGCDYSNYAKMSPAEQEAYMNTFDSPLDFIEWSKKALAEHEAHNESIQASGGDLNLGDYIK